MKFGKTFVSHQIPEWSTHYMDYKHLKKIIKTIDTFINYHSFSPLELPELISSVLSQFFFTLDRDIEKVSDFYDTKFKEYSRRMDRITHVLGYTNGAITVQVDTTDELDEVVSILLELRTIYRNLKWFGELNHKGFIKILKKLDKKLLYLTELANDQLKNDLPAGSEIPHVNLPSDNKEAYLTTRVEALSFANGTELLEGLNTINNMLNQLGDEQMRQQLVSNSISKTASELNVLKIGRNRKYSFDKDSLQKYYELIQQNDSAKLVDDLRSLPEDEALVKLFLSLLNKATLSNSEACIDALFALLEQNYPSTPLTDPYDISGRNFFHQHVVSLGKKQVSKEKNQVIPGESIELNRLYGNKSGPDGIQLAPVRIDGLLHVLRKLEGKPELQCLLMARDNYLRTPLHYAAQYGIKDVTFVLLEHLSRWNLVNLRVAIDDVHLWGDQEGLTPLHLAVIGKHPKTAKNLIQISRNRLSCPNLLLLAARLGCQEIVKDFLEQGIVGINYTDEENNNETALYIAAKLNFLDLVSFLLNQGADPELGESVFGWTPIFVAAAEGYKEIVAILIDAKAQFGMVDDSGWLPMEHASLRGHLEVADMLAPENTDLLLYNIDDPSKNAPRVPNPLSRTTSATTSPFLNPTSEDMLLSTSSIDKLPEQNRNAVNEVYRQFKQLDGSSSSINVIPKETKDDEGFAILPRNRSRSPVNRRKMKPIKSFGHRYLNKDESLILVTLGTTDLRDMLKAIDLNRISMSQSFFTELDTALSLVVTCQNRFSNLPVESPVIIDLPLEDQHGSAMDPISFKLSGDAKAADFVVTFDIVPTYQYPIDSRMHTDAKILGRGVALLDSVHPNVGNHMRSLHNRIAVPILKQDSLEVMGNIKFEYLHVTPFTHPQMSLARSDTYWKQLVSTRVIGHRGLGKNMSNKNSLQLGENTVESFIAAASLGACYVEFDVQITKDHVPVIYHDFLVAETGGDIPMHMLTAEQFLNLSDQHNSSKLQMNRNGNVSKNFAVDDEILSKYNRPRLMSSYPSAPNMSLALEDEELEREFQDQISRRMKLTKTWKEKGFKGNARGLSIASNFVTLKELFKRLPKNVGFNIEIKYPMLDEAQKEDMGDIAFDMNFYIDTILKVIYDENVSGRDILFSSFHPDICLILSLKQPTMPILFLTEAGTTLMADIRASSLQNAIRFAKKWNLLGLVSAAATLVKTPRLALVVKSSGLVCVTYGVQNNDPESCMIQMRAGVDAVIADSVLAVREGLRVEESKEKRAHLV
ncbi:hypothetical protein PUMCH_005102 [Australozyma saopauloensis]|uniref:Uncharacterized protein n=1 Tax=Australozyma saopauloensis TaxID=291208 RepID=A0AAX4HI49_9ASCO|nr:hypothetical protein PUMCH_005102 [[Candida] saopauloensis]